MSTSTSMLPELRIALANFGPRSTRQEMPDGEHQALMITLDGAVAARVTPPGPGR